MFDNTSIERPVPCWKALEWLAEDYCLSVTETVSYDKVYEQKSSGWQENPLAAVVTNNHFCLCKRCYKWSPHATTDLVEYNWPYILESFEILALCTEAYRAFHVEHITHTDPVCFRVAVFCDFLRMVCEDHLVIINVNKFDKLRPEFYIMVKL